MAASTAKLSATALRPGGYAFHQDLLQGGAWMEEHAVSKCRMEHVLCQWPTSIAGVCHSAVRVKPRGQEELQHGPGVRRKAFLSSFGCRVERN